MSGTTIRDQLIANAKDVPSLIAAAQTADPALADALTPKALIASKTVWGSAVGLVVGWVVTKYALGWDPNTCAVVTGLLTLGLTAAGRALASSPISGFFKKGIPL